MLHRLKSFFPSSWFRGYHFLLAHAAALVYGYPSRAMRVIGVTGTNGKSSTVQLAGQLLMTLGKKVGWTTTASFRVGDREWMNDKKMTMLGRFATQKLLRKMVRAGCSVALIETSSQGIEQFRHIGIAYDTLVFTNLTPEHIEAHGGFENYKHAKLKLFARLSHAPRKRLGGVRVPTQILVNENDAHAPEFAAFGADRVWAFGRAGCARMPVKADEHMEASEVSFRVEGTFANVQGQILHTPLVGGFYFENTLAAITVAVSSGYSIAETLRAAESLHPIPGRLEIFLHHGATIIVDYAYEPYALRALYDTVALFHPKRIIQVTGSAGGGRDVARRKEIGHLVAEKTDSMFVTNEDPYDEDPWVIITAIADAAAEAGKVDGETLFRVLDRREAIVKAIALAREGDVVLVTGKGCEPVMAVANGKKVSSDDRVFVKEAMELCLASS